VANTVVLITGCSSGIGKALSEEFHRRGLTVVATARRVESLEELRTKGIRTEKLDVTDEREAERVVQSVLQNEGHIDILVNNAGYGLFGPTVELPDDELAKQFETNVFAPLRLIRLVATSMKSRGHGLIINIGSISGFVTTPFAGAYCASKAALHSLSDALRMELSPFGIRVMTVQPGGIQSEFGNNSGQSAERVMKSASWYDAMRGSILNRAKESQRGATGAAEFARALVRCALKSDPPPIVRIGNRSFSLPLLKKLVPTRWLDALFRKRFGVTA
jgi:short-subunit dehydrogenase